MGFSSTSFTRCLLYNCNAGSGFFYDMAARMFLWDWWTLLNEPINVVKTTYRVDGFGKSLRGLALDSSAYEGLGSQTRILESRATEMNCQK